MAVFQRRLPRTFRQKLKEAIWPSMGMKRTLVYAKHRIIRLPGTPSTIAGGIAMGVAVSFTPFLGLHMVMAGLACVFLGYSIPGMVIGTFLAGNPWTFPFIWISSYKIGRMILGYETARAAAVPGDLNMTVLLKKPFDLLLPMTAGSIPMGILFFIFSFYIFRHLITVYRHARIGK